ncbi:MAG: glycosyltransferase family 2 protein [Deltaproteobacteria bacterium]|nr:glycosyltransferase family 2 protein [Deltaproteobacteria bacterium]
MTPSPLVSIIIVNWNGGKFLADCLGSVYGEPYMPVEVIFVDNGSTDSSVEFVREKFPKTVIIRNSENLGFARANNQGIKAAKGKYVITLNNDTLLEKGFIGELVREAEASGEKTGMWAPKILSLDGKKSRVIDSAGGLLIYRDGLAKGKGRLEKDRGQYDNERDIFIVSACAALYRKSMLDSIGGFDEDFFAYCEDTDLGLRARLAGWKAAFVPGAAVYHYYSGTTGRYTPLKAYLVARNHAWAAIKNFPALDLILFPFYTLWRYAVQAFGMVTGKGAAGRFVEDSSILKLASIVIKAYAHVFLSLPRTLSKRRRIQGKRTVSAHEVRSWFKRYGISAKDVIKD